MPRTRRRFSAEFKAKLALEALGVEDADEVLDELTDDQGRFLDPRLEAAAAAVQAEAIAIA